MKWPPLAGAIATVVLLAGCGGSGSGARGGSGRHSAGASGRHFPGGSGRHFPGGSGRHFPGGSGRHSAGASPPASAPVSSTSSSAAVPIAPGQPQVQVSSFRSPGATVTCQISAESARCAVARPAWAAAGPCPASPWQVLAVTRGGRVRYQCGAAGPPGASPAVKALPYGTVTIADGFACESYIGGVQCGLRAGGQGFFISKPYRRLF